MFFFSLLWFTFSNFYLDFYFPFLLDFNFPFPFFIWNYIFPFLFRLLFNRGHILYFFQKNSLKNWLQIENSGFVKTCDEHVHKGHIWICPFSQVAPFQRLCSLYDFYKLQSILPVFSFHGSKAMVQFANHLHGTFLKFNHILNKIIHWSQVLDQIILLGHERHFFKES